MTPHSPDDAEIASVEDFEAALGSAVLAALRSDIDPYGSWVYQTEAGTTDVEVMVFELDE
jgi:hypothetical protein